MSEQTSDVERFAMVPARARSSVRVKPERKHASKKGRLANGVAQERIAAYGLESILDRVIAGDTLTDIARDVKVSFSSLATYLTADESQEQYARAKHESAEAWSDRGIRYLAEAPSTPAEINRARALAQECARRAAIRNPRYSERNLLELSGPDGGPIRSQVQIAVYLPDNGR